MRIVFTFILLLFSFIAPAHANTATYTVRSIAVEAVGSSATQARKEAVEKGQKQAFATIIRRLAPTVNLAELAEFIPELSQEEEANTISNMVQAMEVHNESVTSTSYKATLDVRFQPEYIQSFLKQNDIAFTERTQTHMLVLPVFFTQSETPHISLSTDWANAWKQASGGTGRNDVKLLFPQPNDPLLASINPIQLLAESYEFKRDSSMQTLVSRYGVSHVLFAAGRFESPNTPNIVTAVRVFGGTSPLNFSESFPISGYEDATSAMVQVANTFRSRVEGHHALLNSNIANTNHLNVTIPLNGLENWLQLQQRLGALRFIRSWELETLSARSAEVQLAFSSKPQNLSEAFASEGFYLEQHDDTFVLNTAAPQSQPSFFNLLPRQ